MSKLKHEIEKKWRLDGRHRRNSRRRDAYRPVKTFRAVGHDGNLPAVHTVLFVVGPAEANEHGGEKP